MLKWKKAKRREIKASKLRTNVPCVAALLTELKDVPCLVSPWSKNCSWKWKSWTSKWVKSKESTEWKTKSAKVQSSLLPFKNRLAKSTVVAKRRWPFRWRPVKLADERLRSNSSRQISKLGTNWLVTILYPRSASVTNVVQDECLALGCLRFGSRAIGVVFPAMLRFLGWTILFSEVFVLLLCNSGNCWKAIADRTQMSDPMWVIWCNSPDLVENRPIISFAHWEQLKVWRGKT